MTAEPTARAASPIIRNILAMGVAQCITWAASTVAILLLPRYLGSADLGRYSLALLAVTIMNIMVDLGVATYLAKQIPRENARRASKLAWSSIGLGLVLSTGVMVLGALAALLLVTDPRTSTILLIMLPLVLLQALFVRASASLRGAQDMSPIAWADGAGRCLTVALMGGTLLTGHGLQAVCVAAVLGAAVTLLLSLLAFSRRFSYTSPTSMVVWKTLTFGGLPFLVWQASLQIYGQIDILILSVMTDHSAVGWYAAAYRLISVPIFAPTIIAGTAFPAISAAAAGGDWSRVSFLARATLRACLVITVPMSFGMAALSSPIVDALGYPADFDHMIPLIAILALHVPIVGVTIVIASCLNAIDRQWSWVKIGLAAAVLNPLINFPLISLTDRVYDNGAIGAAIATLTTEAFMLAGGLALLPTSILGRPALDKSIRTLVAGAVMVAVIWPLQNAPLIALVMAGGLVYVASCILLKAVTPEECKGTGRYLSQRVFRRARRAPHGAEIGQEILSVPPA
jgi:O-antigen/teichoic acid export membrane protein